MKRTVTAAVVVALGLAGIATPAGAAPKKAKAEQATLTIDYATGSGTVDATGAFTGSGTVDTLKSKQAGRTRHFVERLTFGSDTVTLKAVAVRVSRSLDASTCTVAEKDKGAWIITKGTGTLAKAKGAGHFVANATVTGTPDASKPNGCDLSHLTGSIVVTAKGRVKG
jgi:glucose/arabinose dehydrogenase